MNDSKEIKKENEKDITSQVHKEIWSKCLIFTENKKVLVNTFKNNEILESDLVHLLASFKNRDVTIGKGIRIGEQHFDVHSFYPDIGLIYGRSTKINVGFCLMNYKNNEKKKFLFFITFELPMVSANVIPKLLTFANKHFI